MNRWFTLLVGILFILAAVYVYIAFNWWQYFIITLKGIVPIVVAFVGFVFVLIGLTDD